jgi:Flp pilus assembly protein TadD
MTEEEHALYERIVPMVFQQPEFALNLLETMLDDDKPESAAFAYILGNVYFAQSRFEAAETRYREAITGFPDFLRAWSNLGVLFYSRERYLEAIPCFTKALTLGDREVRTLGLLGYCHKRAGNPAAAELAYSQAYLLEPGNIEWIEGLVELAFENGQFGKVETLARQLIRTKPAEVRYWRLLASNQIRQGNPVDAIATLEVAASVNAAEEEDLVLLGDLYVQQGFSREALTAYRRVEARSPGIGNERLIRVAAALIDQAELDAAAEILASVAPTTSAPQKPDLLRVTAALQQARGQSGEATETLEAILALAPLDGPTLIALGRMREAGGDVARAELLYEQAAELPDQAYAANVCLANIALATRRYDRAAGFLERALAIESTPHLQDHLARVRSLLKPTPQP